ncbi:hypothetical protein ACQPW3_23525 [Actinosynnema sp. CA-248983]
MEDRSYYMYYDRTLVVERLADGTRRGFLLDWDTGEFEPADEHVLLRVRGASTTADISGIDEDEFVLRTELVREDRLTGDGPIFALYAAIDTLYARKDAERRRFTEDEFEVVTHIRRRTFALWEQEAARRARGEQPTFTARRKTSTDG